MDHSAPFRVKSSSSIAILREQTVGELARRIRELRDTRTMFSMSYNRP